MSLPDPFVYSSSPHVRKHGPQGYKKYGDYKPFLRDEFTFRCVYCLEREVWYPNREGSFSVDHFIPKAINPIPETHYENLVYSCVRCNSYKQDKILFLDPTQVAFGSHFRVNEDGSIDGLSLEAIDLIDLLDLNHSPALEVRQEALQILELKKNNPTDAFVNTIFLGRFGFPSDLPDLSRLRPPEGNCRPQGIETCYFEMKKIGILPLAY